MIDLQTEPLSNFQSISLSNVKNDRNRQLLNIISKNIPHHAPKSLTDLCCRFSDIFHIPGDQHSVNNFYVQKLNISSNSPIFKKNYRLPHSQKAEIESQVKHLLDQDIIEPSYSIYNSPLLLVPKKSSNGEKNFRLVVDYRELNRLLIPDKFPLPRIDEVLDGLGRARYFSTLDLQAGFHQIPLDPGSRDLTSFSTATGSYRFKVLPFGINVAPNSFARMMTIAFSGLNPATAFIYLDDIIVIGTSQEHHLRNLEKVFTICREKRLKLNPIKCQFMKPEVIFLGHKCTDQGILPDSSKFSTIETYPTPVDKES